MYASGRVREPIDAMTLAARYLSKRCVIALKSKVAMHFYSESDGQRTRPDRRMQMSQHR